MILVFGQSLLDVLESLLFAGSDSVEFLGYARLDLDFNRFCARRVRLKCHVSCIDFLFEGVAPLPLSWIGASQRGSRRIE